VAPTTHFRIDFIDLSMILSFAAISFATEPQKSDGAHGNCPTIPAGTYQPIRISSFDI
jgi:hypothetical protein